MDVRREVGIIKEKIIKWAYAFPDPPTEEEKAEKEKRKKQKEEDDWFVAHGMHPGAPW